MHVAVVCPDMPGHLNPMTTLARAIVRLGHRATLFGLPPSERYAGGGLGFAPIGAASYERDVLPGRDKLAALSGLRALMLTGRLLHQLELVLLQELPEAFRREKISAVLSDQVTPSGASVAMALGLPHAVACNALNLRQEPAIPPAIVGWRHRPGPLGRLRNTIGNKLLGLAARPIRRAVNEYRKRHGLPKYVGADLSSIEAAVEVAQQPAFFDFPRRELPPTFHYTGPWHEPGRDQEVEFPWERLDGRTLIYASLGTLQNRIRHTFAAILEACSDLPLQLVLSLGRRDAVWVGSTPANAVVVPFAPQLDLVRKAALVITHAGLNTTLETLAAGVPMVCLPVTNDQPGVAERVRWLGAGEVLKPSRASPERLREIILRVMKEPSYHEAALHCRDEIARGKTVHDAARLVAAALSQLARGS